MFQVNQRVTCINDSFDSWVYDLFKQLPKKGSIYTIRAICPARTVKGFTLDDDCNLRMDGADFDVLVLLNELHNPDDPYSSVKQELGFKADRFAPMEEIEEEVWTDTFIPNDADLVPVSK